MVDLLFLKKEEKYLSNDGLFEFNARNVPELFNFLSNSSVKCLFLCLHSLKILSRRRYFENLFKCCSRNIFGIVKFCFSTFFRNFRSIFHTFLLLLVKFLMIFNDYFHLFFDNFSLYSINFPYFLRISVNFLTQLDDFLLKFWWFSSNF